MIFLNIGLIWQEQAGRSKEGQFLFRKADKIQSPLYWSPPSLSLSEKYVAKVFSKCGNYIFPTSFDIFKWHLSKYLCQPNCQNWMTRRLNITILWILCNHLHIWYLSQTCLWSGTHLNINSFIFRIIFQTDHLNTKCSLLWNKYTTQKIPAKKHANFSC